MKSLYANVQLSECDEGEVRGKTIKDIEKTGDNVIEIKFMDGTTYCIDTFNGPNQEPILIFNRMRER